MNYIIYHNPKCRKSREALKLIEEKNKKFTVIKYLEDNFDEKSLKKVLEIISKKPSEILRKNEEIWKKQFSNKNLSEDQILAIMIKNPNLIKSLENLKFNLKNKIQPRLAWEVTLLKISSENI